MAKRENQKLKIIYLLKILSEKTDNNHHITMPEIIAELDRYGIVAERKSIYSDISYLKDYGFDINGEQVGKNYEYYIGARKFQLPELKLLVDAVQSSKFITEKKSNELIRKLETLCSENEAKQLQRQVFVSGRVKTMNESIFYNVDRIHQAMAENHKIEFQYWNWNVEKKPELRKDGAKYRVSPWGLSWDDENYYMVAFDDTDKKIKHYRVDKMIHIDILDQKREGRNSYRDIDMADYTKKTFGMFGGEESKVTIVCENHYAGIMIDRFGKDVTMIKKDAEHFTVKVNVAVSPQFIGWIVSLGDSAKVTSPASVVKAIKKESERLYKQYHGWKD